MPQITGTLQGGVIIPAAPLDLPDGSKVEITYPVEESIGMREEDWPTTPEGIAALLERWKEREPLIFTPEEEAEIRAGREWFKQHELEQMRREMESGQ